MPLCQERIFVLPSQSAETHCEHFFTPSSLSFSHIKIDKFLGPPNSKESRGSPAVFRAPCAMQSMTFLIPTQNRIGYPGRNYRQGDEDFFRQRGKGTFVPKRIGRRGYIFRRKMGGGEAKTILQIHRILPSESARPNKTTHNSGCCKSILVK